MSDQRKLAAQFDQLAALMEITGANAFRVNAAKRVSRVLQEFEGNLRELAESPGGLEAMDGIGKGSAERIREWCKTGRLAERDRIAADVPDGLIGLLDISGLGPKTVGRLWREADVTDRATLRGAINDGRLASLPRMGAKTIANISDSLDFAEKAAERTPLGAALPLAERLCTELADVPGTGRIVWAGSLRRGCETIGDIDLLAISTDPASLVRAFTEQPGVTKVLAAGDTKASVRLDDRIQIDLRIVPDHGFGAAWLYFTGSKEHNVELRHRAQQRTLRLNEYGLFEDDGEQTPPQDRGVPPLAAECETDIYTALELPWRPPELRESRDDICDQPPELITIDCIRRDLHTHTTASDGHLSIRKMADEAIRRGYDALAITDHSRSSVQANGLDVERLIAHIEAIREIDAALPNLTLLAGSEVDIHADGSLDYDDEILALLDIVVASPHVALKQSPDAATARLVRAASHPLVHIIGHPTGRMIGRRPGLEPDMHAVCEAAAEHSTALEINANPKRLDLRDRHVRLALESDALISINTDAHQAAHFDFLQYGVLTGRRGGLTAETCINAWSLERLQAWLAR
ncbi:MAG: DNA polymerase/3'-5' exonuclease PolX [Planctomycetes bacterium]|nr:DNA polymerase/3'-5' exonuclease PolX [Planctomycetota bacterium]